MRYLQVKLLIFSVSVVFQIAAAAVFFFFFLTFAGLEGSVSGVCIF